MSLGVSYTRTNHPLAWYVEQDSENPALTRITQKNCNKSDVLSIDAMLPYQNRWVSSYLSTYTTINNQYIGYHYYYDRSMVSISLTYRFSKQKSKYQSRSSINEENQRIKNLD